MNVLQLILIMMMHLLILLLYSDGIEDGGVDIVVARNGVTYVIQCKDHEHTLGNYFVFL